MFVLLFAVSVIVALGLAFGVSLIFRRMTENILSRYLAENVSQATAKYLQIAILLAGVMGGARIQLLKDYLNTPAYNMEALNAQMKPALWSLALYNTAIDSLLGVLWLVIFSRFSPRWRWPSSAGRRSGGCCRSGKRSAVAGPSKPVQIRSGLSCGSAARSGKVKAQKQNSNVHSAREKTSRSRCPRPIQRANPTRFVARGGFRSNRTMLRSHNLRRHPLRSGFASVFPRRIVRHCKLAL
jgi:hypothetical protein